MLNQIPDPDWKEPNQRGCDNWKNTNKRKEDKVDVREVLFELPNVFDM